jgi:hypothetical protein
MILLLFLGVGAIAFSLFGGGDEAPQANIPEEKSELKPAPKPKDLPEKKAIADVEKMADKEKPAKPQPKSYRSP